MNFKTLTVTASEVGDVLDLTDRRIRQLAEEGLFPRESRGKYGLRDCVLAYIASLADGADSDDLRRERIALMKAQRRRIELDNFDREATEHDLDFQLSVVSVLVAWWQLQQSPVGSWLHQKCTELGYGNDAVLIAGAVEGWMIGLRAQIETDLRKAVDAARRKKIVIKDFDTLYRLLGKGKDPYANDYDQAEPPTAARA